MTSATHQIEFEPESFLQKIFARLWAYFSTYPGMIWLWLSGVVLVSVLSINEAVLELSGNKVAILGLMAMLFSATLARSQIKPWLAGLSILSLGLEYVLIFWSNVGPALGQLLLSLTSLNNIPLPQSFLALAQEWITLTSRFQVWLTNLSLSPNNDLLILHMLWGLAIWLSVSFFAWSTWRQTPIIIAVMPLGVLLSINIFFAQGPYSHLAIFVFFTLLLQASTQYFIRQTHWEQQQFDYSEGLATDLNIFLLPLTLLVIVLAAALPTIQYRPLTDFIYIVLNVDAEGSNEIAESFGIQSAPA